MKKVEDLEKRKLISFDWFIKKLMRHKTNYVVLEGFLSVLLEKDIIIQEILESETNKETEVEKSSKVDILCKEINGELIIIELQFCSDIDYFQRILFTASKTISESMSSGEEYWKVKKIYSINILYFDLGQGDDYLYHGVTSYTGVNKHDKLKLNAAQSKKFGKEFPGELYPEYFMIKINNFKNRIKKPIDQWIYFFKNSTLPKEFNAKGLKQVEEKLKYEDMSPELKRQYNKHKEHLLVSLSQLEMAGMEGEIKEKKQTVINGFKNGLEIKMISNIT